MVNKEARSHTDDRTSMTAKKGANREGKILNFLFIKVSNRIVCVFIVPEKAVQQKPKKHNFKLDRKARRTRKTRLGRLLRSF